MVASRRGRQRIDGRGHEEQTRFRGRHGRETGRRWARAISVGLWVVLVLGLPDADGNVILVQPQADVPLGGRLY